MKHSAIAAITVALLFGSNSQAFGLTKEECRAAWKASSAYQSCHPGWGADLVKDGKCGLYVTCKTPSGKEIANGYFVSATRSMWEEKDGKLQKLQPRDYLTPSTGEGRVFYSVEDVRNLHNCNGYLKVGGC